jgi:hypothetical protein
MLIPSFSVVSPVEVTLFNRKNPVEKNGIFFVAVDSIGDKRKEKNRERPYFSVG